MGRDMTDVDMGVLYRIWWHFSVVFIHLLYFALSLGHVYVFIVMTIIGPGISVYCTECKHNTWISIHSFGRIWGP